MLSTSHLPRRVRHAGKFSMAVTRGGGYGTGETASPRLRADAVLKKCAVGPETASRFGVCWLEAPPRRIGRSQLRLCKSRTTPRQPITRGGGCRVQCPVLRRRMQRLPRSPFAIRRSPVDSRFQARSTHGLPPTPECAVVLRCAAGGNKRWGSATWMIPSFCADSNQLRRDQGIRRRLCRRLWEWWEATCRA